MSNLTKKHLKKNIFLKYFIIFYLKLIGLLCIENNYMKINNFGIPFTNNSNYLIKSIAYNNTYKCLAKCNQINTCVYISIDKFICRLYIKYAYLIVNESIFGTLYLKKTKDIQGLIHHWPIFDSNVSDIINRKDLYAPFNAAFTTDRYGVSNSAIKLNYGYYKAPNGTYFNSDFTITAWVKVNSQNILDHGTVLDFGNGPSNNQIFFAYSYFNCRKPVLHIYSSSNSFLKSNFTTFISESWYHIAVVLKNVQSFMYINGSLFSEGDGAIPRNVNRSSNFIGGTNWNAANANADFDDIKIFDRALSSAEILEDFFSSD